METLTLPTKEEAENIERILLETYFVDGEYIAKCMLNGKQLETGGKPRPYAAIQHLINVVVERKEALGQLRDVDYIFTTKVD